MTKNNDDDENASSKGKNPTAKQPFRDTLKTMKRIFKPEDLGDDGPPDFDDGEKIKGDGSTAEGSDEVEEHGNLDDFHYGEDQDHQRFLALLDMGRWDRALELARVGKPRIANLSSGPKAIARLAEDTSKTLATRRGDRDGRDGDKVARELALTLSEPMSLVGPSTHHAVDELIAEIYADFPTFAEALEAIRQSALLGISRGAVWFQFRPIIIVSEPGSGKSTMVRRLASAANVPALHLDGSTISTATPFVGSDAVFRSSRASELVQHVCQYRIANPLFILDEGDKMTDVSTHGRADASEVLLGLLERDSARKARDSYLNIDVDLSFASWLILVNDLDRISPAVRDRCKVIVVPPLEAKDLAAIARREIERRGLEPELVAPLIHAVRTGRLKSLRKLHKSLDAAAAVMTRTRLH
jgi:DNA polymerase III delta prime subunit